MSRDPKWAVTVVLLASGTACSPASPGEPTPTRAIGASSATSSATPSATPTVTPPTSPTAATNPTLTGTVEQQLTKAYADYSHALEKAFLTNDTNSPEIRATSTGGQLTLVIEALIKADGLGHINKGTVPRNATVVSIAPDHKSAVMTICDNGRSWQMYDAATGKQLPSEGLLARSTTTFVLTSGVWKASKSVLRGVTAC